MMKKATFGAGCFWCIDACFRDLKGVLKVSPGYMGGTSSFPTYEEVCTGTTGHVEVAQIEFDETQLSFSKLLELFWFVHNPTQLNRQGNDIGTQYRSVIFYHDETQRQLSEDSKCALENGKVWSQPIVTTIESATEFYPAEDYHHNYFNDNPQNQYCQFVVRPKVEKFRKVFDELMS